LPRHAPPGRLNCLVATCVFAAFLFSIAPEVLGAAAKVDFAKDIQPIFEKNCYECHGAEKDKSGLRLHEKSAALKGGDNGKLLIPGDSKNSLLIHVVEGTDPNIAKMPQKRDPLTTDQIKVLRTWIDEGANWPDATANQGASATEHWAFKAPVRPTPPA